MMLKIICGYLSANYHVLNGTNSLDYESHTPLGVYRIGSNYYVNPHILLEELCDVFLINKIDACEYVDFWANIDRHPTGPKFPIKLREYWISSGLFPKITRVANRTVGLDLVSVESLPAPKLNFIHFECLYKKDKWYKKISNKIVAWFK